MNISTILVWGFGIALVGLIGWIGASLYVVWDIEEPKYQVVKRTETYEIRRYEPYLIAEVDMTSTDAAFPVLAKYIFGDNQTKSQIKMTAPVVTDNKGKAEDIGMTAPVFIEREGAAKDVMSFVMPGRYTLETLPEPNDKRIRIKQMPARMIAVLSYSWSQSERRFGDNAEVLKQKLVEDGVKIISQPYFAGYNPPFTFPPLIRNEVWIEVEGPVI